MKPLASRVSPTAYGARSACETRKSWPLAALPPTWVVIPSPAGIARMTGIRSVASGRDGGSGLIASSRTVLPRTYCARQGVETGRSLADGLARRARRPARASARRRSPGRGW